VLQNAFIKAIQSGQTEISKAQLGLVDAIVEKPIERLKMGFL
jgi:hypothetical protein